jgi:hypothetical protein
MSIHRLSTAARAFALFLLAFACVASAQEAGDAAPAVDWSRFTDVDTIFVVTADEDGASRETKIWIAVVDGQAYIRTGGTTWGDNVKRDPAITLRIEGADYPVDVTFIEDDALRERVETTFREKYGWSDAVIGLIRGSRPLIMQVASRS